MFKTHIILGLLLTSPTLAQRWEPFPICLSCIPQALLDAPAIGFDLSSSYGTVAVKLNNGSIVNVAKVEGDEEYRLLMMRFSGHGAPSSPASLWPLDKFQAILKSSNQRTWDQGTASQGRSDLDILSNFLQRLRQSAETYINETVDLALATHPSLPHLEREFLEQAFDMAGMSHLRSYKALHRLDSIHHVVSSLAGLGFGICKHWNDSRACENEDRELPWKQTLAISFSNDALIVSNTLVVGPHRFEDVKETVHLDLGLNRGGKYHRENNKFWVKVREAIEAIPVSVRSPDLLLIFGDAASNKNFLEAVKLAFHNMDLDHLFENWESTAAEQDTLYLPARGAAEIAKVWQASEWNCLEPYSCDHSRPENDGEGSTLREMFEKRARWNESCVIGECKR